jgi:hypothetical protein
MRHRGPQNVELPTPRELREYERALLDFVLSGPLASDELRVQAVGARVVAECDCGCRSVVLEPPRQTPSASIVHPVLKRTDWAPLTAWGQTSSGTEIEVTVHVLNGRLSELEIWDGVSSTHGESRGELPDLETLEHDLKVD